jgi:hypothetical protein
MRQYENTVLPAARRYLVPSKPHANLVLDSEVDVGSVEKRLCQAIMERHHAKGESQ